MDSSQVTRRQAQAIEVRVEEIRDYLYRLRFRMAKRGFPPDDQLFALVQQAELAIGELYVDVQLRARSGPAALPSRTINPLDRGSARRPPNER